MLHAQLSHSPAAPCCAFPPWPVPQETGLLGEWPLAGGFVKAEGPVLNWAHVHKRLGLTPPCTDSRSVWLGVAGGGGGAGSRGPGRGREQQLSQPAAGRRLSVVSVRTRARPRPSPPMIVRPNPPPPVPCCPPPVSRFLLPGPPPHPHTPPGVSACRTKAYYHPRQCRRPLFLLPASPCAPPLGTLRRLGNLWLNTPKLTTFLCVENTPATQACPRWRSHLAPIARAPNWTNRLGGLRLNDPDVPACRTARPQNPEKNPRPTPETSKPQNPNPGWATCG